jgi:hypothetical protein
MCPQKVCPECFRRIPARATECTTNGCHHIFDESQPSLPTFHDAGIYAPITARKEVIRL